MFTLLFFKPSLQKPEILWAIKLVCKQLVVEYQTSVRRGFLVKFNQPVLSGLNYYCVCTKTNSAGNIL